MAGCLRRPPPGVDDEHVTDHDGEVMAGQGYDLVAFEGGICF